MRHYITSILFAILLAQNLSAQIFDPDRPMIMPFTICVDSINDQMGESLKNPVHEKLSENLGWVEIPSSYYRHNGKSQGIIIVQNIGYNFRAFDARCPHCFYDEEITDSRMRMYGRLSAICPVCSAEAQSIVYHGIGQLTRYNHKADSPAYMNAYLVKVIKKGKKTYLRIVNAPNGACDEWKELPENQFLRGIDPRM